MTSSATHETTGWAGNPGSGSPPHEAEAEALGVVAAHLPHRAKSARNARFLTAPDAAKNRLIAFESDGERLVLKVFTNGINHTVLAYAGLLTRYLPDTFALRGTGAERAQNEVDSAEAFRAAGFEPFELVARPAPHVLVQRFHKGRGLRALIRREQDAGRVLALVGRYASEIGRRQRIALERRQPALVHAHPRLQHVWVTPDDRFLYFDFEGIVNPAMPFERRLAFETDRVLGGLAGWAPTSRPELLRAAADGLGEESMARWRQLPRRSTPLHNARPVVRRRIADELLARA